MRATNGWLRFDGSRNQWVFITVKPDAAFQWIEITRPRYALF